MAIPVNIDDLVKLRTVESTRVEFKADFNPNPIIHTISYAPHPCQDASRPTPRPLPSEGGGAGLHLRARNSQSEQASR